MIFSVSIANKVKHVDVYDSTEHLSSSVEWQDILDNDLTIIDEIGNIYQWDNSKTKEIGTTYNYTLKICGFNPELSREILNTYTASNKPSEFLII